MEKETKHPALVINNFKLQWQCKKDRPIVARLNKLAQLAEREPAEVYRMALEKGVLMVAAQHGIDPSLIQEADAQLADAS